MKTIEEELIQACKEYTAALDFGNGEARDTASDIWNKRIDTYNEVWFHVCSDCIDSIVQNGGGFICSVCGERLGLGRV